MADSRAFEAFWVFEAALVVGRHWNDQEGVNSAYLDALADAVAEYDRSVPRRPEPQSIKSMRAGLQLWQRRGVCPDIVLSQHACPWTCRSCKTLVPATVDSAGHPQHVRCRMLEEREEQTANSRQQTAPEPEAPSPQPPETP